MAITKEWAINYAHLLMRDYPELQTANEIIDRAITEGRFKNETECLAVWGRLMKITRRGN